MSGERGRFITLEGGEGAGKSTQLRKLVAALQSTGLEVVATREPGGSPGAEEIRRLLVEGHQHRWDGLTEALLHFAARRDHLRSLVWPALERGAWVVSDRFADSTLAYQGYGHGLERAVYDDLYRLAVGDFRPDVTLIMDIPVSDGLKRASDRGGGEDRYESMDREFHERLRAGFLEIARLEPDRCHVIDATADEGAVAEAVRDAVANALKVQFP
ncbi:MAG: dTMP kinase [Desulfuromonadales bacterium]|nr:dTMP kinase [Desulfuromonadales bacterium]